MYCLLASVVTSLWRRKGRSWQCSRKVPATQHLCPCGSPASARDAAESGDLPSPPPPSLRPAPQEKPRFPSGAGRRCIAGTAWQERSRGESRARELRRASVKPGKGICSGEIWESFVPAQEQGTALTSEHIFSGSKQKVGRKRIIQKELQSLFPPILSHSWI